MYETSNRCDIADCFLTHEICGFSVSLRIQSLIIDISVNSVIDTVSSIVATVDIVVIVIQSIVIVVVLADFSLRYKITKHVAMCICMCPCVNVPMCVHV